MKELKLPIITTQAPKTQRFVKRWLIANQRGNHKVNHMRNNSFEFTYHQVIKVVKQRYMKPGEVYFERDYKHDRVDSISMHGFITPCFLLRLGCSVALNYEIDFAFYNCPFETEVREMLRPIYVYRNEISPQPDFPTYYKAVLNYQPAECIYTF